MLEKLCLKVGIQVATSMVAAVAERYVQGGEMGSQEAVLLLRNLI